LQPLRPISHFFKRSDRDVTYPQTHTHIHTTETLQLATNGMQRLCICVQAEQRVKELESQGIQVNVVAIGKKGATYFKRRPQYKLVRIFELGQSPTTKEAQGIADEIFAEFVAMNVDKVEMVYTKFQSLIKSDPVVQSMLPLTPAGDMCDIDGNCIDPAEDELFKLTTIDGTLTLERETARTETADFDQSLIFEQDPEQLLDALLPLYLNSVILRALQESLASELAARMNAMHSASDNAKQLSKSLSTVYNRKRQAAITNQILEICGGAAAV
jgi:F-type H+-transporting ATPase subunit gamma